MTEKKIYPNYVKERQRVTLIKSPEIKDCWKAKEIAENKDRAGEKVNCPYFRVYNHKGICVGNRKQRRDLKCYR